MRVIISTTQFPGQSCPRESDRFLLWSAPPARDRALDFRPRFDRRCGDLHFGFARVQCPDCRHEMFVAFSCQQRCHSAPAVTKSEPCWPLRPSPKPSARPIRIGNPRSPSPNACRYDRSLLGGLAQAAWTTVAEVYRDVLQCSDVTLSMIAVIQIFGELIHFHPHIHAIVTDGAFTHDGTFICLPKIGAERLLATWQAKVFDLFLAAEKIDQETMDQMRSWPHSGFSVDKSVYIPPHDTSGLERLAQYILRCRFSLARVVRLTDGGSVIYRAE